MNHCRRITSLVLSFAILPFQVVVAEQFKQHAAHEHGVALLNLVQEDDQVVVELISPAANIVGFEHTARTDEERATLQKANEQLEQAIDLFAFTPEAGCMVSKVDLDVEIFSNGDKDSHSEDHDHHHEDEHTDKHAGHHEDEDDHHASDEDHHDDKHAKDNHHDDHHAEASHSDIVATYTFSCDKPAAIDFVDVKLFSVFPGFEEINAQIISNKGQQAIALTASNNSIKL